MGAGQGFNFQCMTNSDRGVYRVQVQVQGAGFMNNNNTDVRREGSRVSRQ